MRRNTIRLKRVYEPPGPDDGLRVLVDALWPRGLSKQAVSADLWLKDAAPSNALRRWYGHDPRRWEAFRRKYRAELARRPEILRLIDDLRRRAPVTLLFGARDEARNNAVVLREMLENQENPHESQGHHDLAGDQRRPRRHRRRDRRAAL